jgi:hypothetical protein
MSSQSVTWSPPTRPNPKILKNLDFRICLLTTSLYHSRKKYVPEFCIFKSTSSVERCRNHPEDGVRCFALRRGMAPD